MREGCISTFSVCLLSSPHLPYNIKPVNTQSYEFIQLSIRDKHNSLRTELPPTVSIFTCRSPRLLLPLPSASMSSHPGLNDTAINEKFAQLPENDCIVSMPSDMAPRPGSLTDTTSISTKTHEPYEHGGAWRTWTILYFGMCSIFLPWLTRTRSSACSL